MYSEEKKEVMEDVFIGEDVIDENVIEIHTQCDNVKEQKAYTVW